MSLKYELLLIAILIATTLGAAHALESGALNTIALQQLFLSRG